MGWAASSPWGFRVWWWCSDGWGGSARGEVPPGAFGCHRCRWVRWVSPELGEPREICASVLSSLSN